MFFLFLFFFYFRPHVTSLPGRLSPSAGTPLRALPRCAGLSVLLGDTRAADGVERTGRDNPTYIFSHLAPVDSSRQLFFSSSLPLS